MLLTGNLCRGVGHRAPAAAAAGQVPCQGGGQAQPGGGLRGQLEDPFGGHWDRAGQGQGRRCCANRLFLCYSVLRLCYSVLCFRYSLLCFCYSVVCLERWTTTVDHTLVHCRKVVLVAWKSLVRRGTGKSLVTKSFCDVEKGNLATLATTKDEEFARLCAEIKIESPELCLKTDIVNYDAYDGDDGDGEHEDNDGLPGIPLC